MEIKNYLLGYEDMYIYQDTDGFNFSLDSVLLANFVTLNKKTRTILDIGCGNAPIPLIMSTKIKSKIIGVEIQPKIFALAKKSVTLNNLDNQIEIINDDINKLYKNIESDSVDTITCNPPFFKLNGNSKLNNCDSKAIARHEINLTLEDIFKIAKKILKNNGNIAIVHRPERIVDIIILMKQNNIEPKRIRFVYPKKNKESNILLIEGTKNGKSGIKIESPLITHLENGEYTYEIKKYFERN